MSDKETVKSSKENLGPFDSGILQAERVDITREGETKTGRDWNSSERAYEKADKKFK